MKRTEYFKTQEGLDAYYPNGIPSGVLAIVGDEEEQILYTSSNNSPSNIGTTVDQGGYNISPEDADKLNDAYEFATTYGASKEYVAEYVSTYGSSTDLTGYATESYVVSKIEDVVGAAPAALDTLKEIGDSLNNDADFAGTMTAALAAKANANAVYTKTEIDTMLDDYATEEFATVPVYDSEAGYVRYRQMGKTMQLIGAAEMKHDGVDEDGKVVATYFVLDDMASKSYVANYVSTYGGGEDNVQADWNESDSTADSYILNKPDVGIYSTPKGGAYKPIMIYNEVHAYSTGTFSGISTSEDGLTLTVGSSWSSFPTDIVGQELTINGKHYTITQRVGNRSVTVATPIDNIITTGDNEISIYWKDINNYIGRWTWLNNIAPSQVIPDYIYNSPSASLGSAYINEIDSMKQHVILGVGTKNSSYNAIHITKDGNNNVYTYVYGVGNYNGRNIMDSDSYDLAYVINDLQDQIDNIPSGGTQADWNESDSSSDAYIKNKPGDLVDQKMLNAVFSQNAARSAAQYTYSGQVVDYISYLDLASITDLDDVVWLDTTEEFVENGLTNIIDYNADESIDGFLDTGTIVARYYEQNINDADYHAAIGIGMVEYEDENENVQRVPAVIDTHWEVPESNAKAPVATPELKQTYKELATKEYVESLIGTALSLSEIIVGEETEPTVAKIILTDDNKINYEMNDEGDGIFSLTKNGAEWGYDLWVDMYDEEDNLLGRYGVVGGALRTGDSAALELEADGGEATQFEANGPVAVTVDTTAMEVSSANER